MANTAGGGGGSQKKATPSIGQPKGVYVLDWNGVKITYDKNKGVIILPGGKRLPAGSTINASKKTIDLPNGKHLSFKNGKVLENTPKPKRDKLAKTEYTQRDFLTGKPVSSSTAAPVKQPRSGDDNRQPAPVSKTAPKAAPASPTSSRDQIRARQIELNKQGANLVVDGIYGPKTKAAEAKYGGSVGGGGGTVPGTSAGGGAAPVAGAAPATGGATGPTAPAPAGTTPATADVDVEVRRMFGEVAAFLSHPELGPILRQAAKEGWDNSRLFGALQQTKFWRTTPDVARKWTIVSTLDPATAKSMADQQTQDITAFARQNGLTFSNEHLAKFGTEAAKHGWTGAQVREQLFAKAATGAKDTGALDTNIAMQYGYLAAFLDEPQIGDLLRRAARNGWSAEQLEVELRKTDWWKETTDAQRRWDALNEQSPEDANAQMQNRAAEISAMAQQQGIRLAPDRLEQIAADSMRYGWSSTQVKNAVTREYQYGGGTQPGTAVPKRGPMTPGERAGVVAPVDTPNAGEEFGFAGQTAREIRAMAGQYLVPISEQMMEKWTEQIVRGETDMEGFNSYLVEQAKSLFPGMANALDRGVTVAQYADPYKQVLARELEVNPETIDLNDPRYRKVLDQTDEKGNRVSMTLSESAEYARSLPQWQETRGANEKGAALTEALLQTFGKVA